MHTSGVSSNKQDIVDNDLGIMAQNSYRLKRIVEMYQHRETLDKYKGTYTYEGIWSDV